MYKSQLLNEIVQRGFVKDCTNIADLDEKMLNPGSLCLYHGIDLTAPSTHIGHLMQLMLLLHFYKAGCKVIILLGGATTRIGDPSGKDTVRKMLKPHDITNNGNEIRAILERFFEKNCAGQGGNDNYYSNESDSKCGLRGDCAKGGRLIFVNNYDWADSAGPFGLSYIEFLSCYGRAFSVNKMLAKDSVKTRLERKQHLTFLEFNYMILQAIDFAELYKRFGCILQTGGSEQWGNITAGIDLINTLLNTDDERIKVDKKFGEPMGLTTNLITTSDGKKMGKTEGGALWMRKDMTLPFDLYQYFRNVNDDLVEPFLKMYTTYSLQEICDIMSGDINEAKAKLASAVVKVLHGSEEEMGVLEMAKAAFETNDVEKLPTVEVPASAVCTDAGGFCISIIELLKLSAEVASNSQARKLIAGGGVKVNDVRIEDEKAQVQLSCNGPLHGHSASQSQGEHKNQSNGATPTKLSVGKKKHFKVVLI